VIEAEEVQDRGVEVVVVDFVLGGVVPVVAGRAVRQAGLFAYGRGWTVFGPRFRPLAVVSIVTYLGHIVVGMQPPYDRAGPVVLLTAAVLTVGWFGYAPATSPARPSR
jgi:hypothetical protein